MHTTLRAGPHQKAMGIIYPNYCKPDRLKQKISVLAKALLATLALTPSFLAAQAPFGIQSASARAHYGILGSQAPELDLETWIDGRGVEMTPIPLSAYRGKVIYLYFFQDW